jgi:hypothetical protein
VISLRQSGPLRIAILFVAIFAVLSVSLASTSAAHIHARSTGGQCDICVTAHVVSLEAQTVFHLVGAVAVYENLTPAEIVAGYQLFLASSASSRGPPSLL